MKKILVVDDSEIMRREVGTCLKSSGYAVVEASNGYDALTRIAEHEDLAMMLLDINMPGMSGLELLERMRESDKTAVLPVLVLTTEADPAIVDRARSIGAKGWVIKPVKGDLLVNAVKKLAL